MANFGETLRRERELRDISLREIADATKINLRYLEALEQNRFDILPGGVFNKGFIRAYARFIGADGEAFVDGYLQEMAAREAQANAGGAAAPPAGLHRPSESPKRRAGSDPAAPVEGPRGNGEPAAHIITFAEQAARPPANAPAPHSVFMEAVAASAGTKSSARTAVITLSLIGVAAVALLGLWLVRGLRPAAPIRPPAPPPTASTVGATAAESTATTDPGAAAVTATDDIMSPTQTPRGADTEAGTGEGTTTEPSSKPAPYTMPGQVGPSAIPPTREPAPAWRDDSIDRPADQGGAPHPATTPPRVQIAAPVPPPLPGLAAPAPRAEPPAGPMEFRIEATAPVWVQIACDGDDRLNRALQPGEGVTLRCLGFIRLSVTDIGAVRLMVNGGRCAAPGERGSRIEGFVIRAEDAAVICPTQQGAAHGRS